MLDTKYYKDYKHNYLIIKDSNCLSENVYQRKMLTENNIRGLIPTAEKHIIAKLHLSKVSAVCLTEKGLEWIFCVSFLCS